LCDIHFLCTQSAVACCTPVHFAGGLASDAKGWQLAGKLPGKLMANLAPVKVKCAHLATPM